MKFSDFRSAVLNARGRKPAQRVENVVGFKPMMHQKSPGTAYFDDGNDPMVFRNTGWEFLAIVVWIVLLVVAAP